MITCPICSKETSNPKFCSRSCSAVNSNKTTIKRKRTLKCKKCSCLIYKGTTYCKKCWIEKSNNSDLEIGSIIYSKHHRSSAFALIRARARKFMMSRVKICQKCGYDKHVEVCHIKPISDFPLTSKLSEVNHIDNLMLLCPNCHWEFDHK